MPVIELEPITETNQEFEEEMDRLFSMAERFIPEARDLGFKKTAVELNQGLWDKTASEEEIKRGEKLGDEMIGFVAEHRDKF